MGKPTTTIITTSSATTDPQPGRSKTPVISKEVTPGNAKGVMRFFSNDRGTSDSFVDNYSSMDAFSDIVGGLLKSHVVQRGRVSCVFTVLPAFNNSYNGLHGGAVATVAEKIAIACVRTVVTEDKELFFGELNVSYLSAAQEHEEVVVEGSVVRSGRNLSVVAIEFKTKKTGKLVYVAHATIYHMPTAKL